MNRQISSVNHSIIAICCLCIATFYACTLQAQNTAPNKEEQSLLFQPLRGNIFEARVGSFYQFEDEKLRLDIGNSTDLLQFGTEEESQSKYLLSFGADFMTYTRLRSDGNFKFPVETTDFYFGINAAFVSKRFHGSLFGGAVKPEARIRLAHISSHLVDGHQATSSIENESFTYSREFFDAVVATRWVNNMINLRIYAGAIILFSVLPDDFGVFHPQLGFDGTIESLGGTNLHGVFGYDAKMHSITSVSDANQSQFWQSAQVGIKLGDAYGRGVSWNVYWYDGISFHGMFYSQYDSYIGTGFQVEW